MKLILLILILTAYCITGTFDYQHAVDQESYYQEMVDSGVWPDYRK